MAACILESELQSVLFLLLSCYKALGKGLHLSSWRVCIYKRNTSRHQVDQDSPGKLADLVYIYVQGLGTGS